MDRVTGIMSPAVRFLRVSDVARASAFYRNVLGFELRGEAPDVEAIAGPACIRFVTGTPAAAGESADMPGSAVLFLQTDDVAAQRASLCAAGGLPSKIERVNWIKMSMFEIRDPDENVIWFGQTYHEEQASPSWRVGQPRGLRQALPELPVKHVAAAVTYYCDVLGFHINHQQEDLGVLDRDAITVLLRARGEQHTGIGSFTVYVENADSLYAELSAKGARVQGPPISRPWGLRDFSVLDLADNRITFAQTFE
jgi:catechol 2,3-dioxygenase-like lactoylglutathione lyase family enzyme